MNVTNNSSNTMVIGSAVIPAGATGEVEDWDTVKDGYAVKRFLAAKVISVEGKVAPVKPLTKDEVIASLKDLGVDADGRKSLADLTAQLDEAKAKAKA